MSRIEVLIRDSLHSRAQDVEPTPALWERVQRRADRRRRLTVVTWSLAAAAAAVVAVAALPTLVGLFTSPQAPEIVPLEEVPVGPGTSLPTHAVTTDGARLFLHDLATGDITAFGGGPDGHQVVDIAVRPGSTADDLVVAAATVAGDGSPPRFQVVTYTPDGTTRLDMPALAGDGVPSLAWSADGRWLAWLDSGAADADGNVVAYAPYVDGEIGFVQDLAVIDGAVRLTGWTGPTADPNASSLLWYVREDGAYQLPMILHEDGFEPGEPRRPYAEDELDAVPVRAPDGQQRSYLLFDGPDGPQLHWSGPDASTTLLEVPDELLAGAPERLRLAGHLDAVAVTNGQQAWLVTHRAGSDVQVAALAGTIRAIDLFGGAAVRPDPTATPTAVPDGEAQQERDAAVDRERDADAAARIGGPVLIADGRNLDVLDADGRHTVYTFPEEGHSTFLSLAVRPGSTVDDLTAVALTTAEGMYDLRTIRLVDGQAIQEVFPEPYRPGATATGVVEVEGPLWAPDGTSLAWIERAGDRQVLRTLGWDGGPGTGDEATDNAAFDLPRDLLALTPQQWEQVTAGRFEIWATNPDSNQGWYAIVLERQADDAWAIPAGQSPVEVRSAPGSPGDPVAAVAGIPGTGEVTWMVRTTFDGGVLIGDPYGDAVAFDLPAQVQWDDGVPSYRLATVGGGVLVQGAGAAAWLAPGEEPVVIGASGHAVPIR